MNLENINVEDLPFKKDKVSFQQLNQVAEEIKTKQQQEKLQDQETKTKQCLLDNLKYILKRLDELRTKLTVEEVCYLDCLDYKIEPYTDYPKYYLKIELPIGSILAVTFEPNATDFWLINKALDGSKRIGSITKDESTDKAILSLQTIIQQIKL